MLLPSPTPIRYIKHCQHSPHKLGIAIYSAFLIIEYKWNRKWFHIFQAALLYHVTRRLTDTQKCTALWQKQQWNERIMFCVLLSRESFSSALHQGHSPGWLSLLPFCSIQPPAMEITAVSAICLNVLPGLSGLFRLEQISLWDGLERSVLLIKAISVARHRL